MTTDDTKRPPWGDEITPLTEVADGRYVLLHELAQGDRSIVYRAKPTGSAVSIAFKLIQPRYVGDEAEVRRFRREAELLRKIEHPHIVRLVDEGQIEDGRDFIALELLVGRTLAEELDGGNRIAPERTCTIARQVAHALAAMHRVGVVHRDLQPENILLVGSEAREQVKLVDLSDAGDVGAPARRVRAARRRDSGRILADGYRAPEQLRKRPPHSGMDVFALGVIMFEMLAGEHPFASATSAVPTQLGSRTIRTKVFDAPEELLGLVADCIELDASERPRSVDEVIARLDKALLWMGVVPPTVAGDRRTDEEAPTQAYRAAEPKSPPEPDRVKQRVGAVKGSFDAEIAPGGPVAGDSVDEFGSGDDLSDSDTWSDADRQPAIDDTFDGEDSDEVDVDSSSDSWFPEPDAPRSSESVPHINAEEIRARAAAKGQGDSVVDTVAWTKPQRSADPSSTRSARSARSARNKSSGDDVELNKTRRPERRPSAPVGPPRWVVPLVGLLLVLLAYAVWMVWSQ